MIPGNSIKNASAEQVLVVAREFHEAKRINRLRRLTGIDALAESIVASSSASFPRRAVVGLAGFPASGKTTLGHRLVKQINQDAQFELAAHVPMDGYHMRNRELARVGLLHKKGAPETFHAAAFAAALAKLKAAGSGELRFPTYDREIHEVVDDAVLVLPEVRIIVTEGLYVGLEQDHWREASLQLDALYFLDCPVEKCVERIVERNINAGRSAAEIQAKIDNDLSNCRHILGTLQFRPILVTDD